MATSLSTRSVAPVYRARGALMGQSICAYRLLIIYYVFGELRGSKSINFSVSILLFFGFST